MPLEVLAIGADARPINVLRGVLREVSDRAPLAAIDLDERDPPSGAYSFSFIGYNGLMAGAGALLASSRISRASHLLTRAWRSTPLACTQTPRPSSNCTSS
jgi:hypothetical protein